MKQKLDVSLRDSDESDYDFFWQLHCLEKDHIDKTWGWDEAWHREDFTKMVDYATWKIIQADSEEVGVYAVKEEDGVLWLKYIVLLPEWQGQGIGGKFVRDLLSEAAGSKKKVRLNVLKVNESAQRLYKRHGFRVVEDIDGRHVMEASPGS